jgi:CheY-like chemotaxis protein
MAESGILIVEDDNIIVMELQDRLQTWGYTIAGIVSSGRAAVEKAAETQADLVLMDIRLKGSMSGLEAAEAISNRWGIPVVYLTALADENTLQQIKKTGASGCIIKPFEGRELRDTIETILGGHEQG